MINQKVSTGGYLIQSQFIFLQHLQIAGNYYPGMRRIFTVCCALGLISLYTSSCEELLKPDEVLSFEGRDILVDFIIDPLDAPGYRIFKEETVRENLDSLFEANDFSADRLESVDLVNALVEITGPSDTMSLSYLDMVIITIYTAELGEKTIAEKLNIPSGVKKVELEIKESNMRDYLETEEYILTVFGKINTRSYEERELEARIKYKFTMSPGL